MADFKSHIAFSTVLGGCYGVAGHFYFNLPVETSILGAGLCSVSGMLPDLDSDSGTPVREMSTFAASVIPMLMLPRIGLARTTELTLSGRMMEASESHSIGLIQHLVPTAGDVIPKTREVARMLAGKPAIAMRLNKQRLRQVTQDAFDEAFKNGGAYQAEAFASGEPQTAMRAFFAERTKRRAARDAVKKN